MSKGGHDIFALLINFWGWLEVKTYYPWIFCGRKYYFKKMVKTLIELFNKYGLKKNCFIDMKDEGSNHY
jgi:hypothetical protein